MLVVSDIIKDIRILCGLFGCNCVCWGKFRETESVSIFIPTKGSMGGFGHDSTDI